MEKWTLVYLTHCSNEMTSRQRFKKWYGSAAVAYDAFQRAREEIKWYYRKDPKDVSRAYVIRPDGAKIPLVSSAPPHHAIAREWFMQAVTHPGPLPARQEHLPVNREILYRRLMSAWTQASHISADASKVLLDISDALFWGSEHKLATACELQLGPPGVAPRTCPPEREPLQRRLRGLARQARSAFPETARVLTYLEHAVARRTEHDLLTVCEPIETFTGRILGRHDEAGSVQDTGP